MDEYLNMCLQSGKLITHLYSTSFSKGIRTMHKDLHFPVYAIYGFVRLADEIVDTFHNHNKKELIENFKTDTFDAINSGISLNPVLNGFQFIVNKYNIDHHLIDAFFISMEMDLEKQNYSAEDLKTYIYGSAEVIGLMCLRVFCYNNSHEFENLKTYAQKLGSAFQKINFLRDIGADYKIRNRFYFTGISENTFTQKRKEEIESEIKNEFQFAFRGVLLLDNKSRYGVWLAYSYYSALLSKIEKTPASLLFNTRIRVSSARKFFIYLKIMLFKFLRIS